MREPNYPAHGPFRNRYAGSMLVDLHNHTRFSSPCSHISAEELIDEARRHRLDAICVTEHLFQEGANVAVEVGRRMGFPVFRGVEARSAMGDMLVYGYGKDIPEDISLDDLCWLVHEVHGVVFAAHPFHVGGGRTLSACLGARGINLETDWEKVKVLRQLDGIEVENGQVSPAANARARLLAARLNVPGVGGSDAHSVTMVGKAATRFDRRIHSDQDLVLALKNGCYRAVRLRPAAGS